MKKRLSFLSFPIVKKHLKSLLHEKSFLIIIGLLLFIVMAISILIATFNVVYNPALLLQEDIRVGVYGDSELYPYFFAEDKISLFVFDNETDAQDAFVRGEIDAILFIEYFYEEGFYVAHVQVPRASIEQSLVLSLLKPVFERIESFLQDERSEYLIWPTELSGGNSGTQGIDSLYEILLGIVIPLLVIIPAFLIGNMFVDAITQEHEEGHLQIMFSTISPLRYVREYIFEGLLLVSLTTVVMLLLLYMKFPFLKHLGYVFVVALVYGLFICTFGIFCGMFFEQKQSAQLIYSFGLMGILFSSTIFHYAPLYVISDLLLGYTRFLGGTLIAGVVAVIFVYGILWVYVRKKYYC